MKFKKLILFFFLILNLFNPGIITAQTLTNTDSLLRLLKKAGDNIKPNLYLEIGNSYLEKRNYDESINYLYKAISLASGREKNEILMKSYFKLGDCFYYKRDYDNAIKNCFKSLEIAKGKDKEFQINIYLSIAYCYQDLLKYDKSINYLDKAIELTSGQENNIVMTKVFYVRGGSYLRKGDVEKSLKDFFRALEIAKAIRDKDIQSRILNDIGSAYKTKGDYQKAIEYFQENLKNQELSGDSAEIGKTLNNIGNVYYSFGINSKAIEYYGKSMEIFQKLHKENFVGFLLYNIGISYEKEKDNNKALEYLKKSHALFQKLNFKPGIAQAQSEMGSIYSEEGNFQLALKYHEEALEVYKAIGEKMNTAVTYRSIAETYNRSGNYITALSYYKQSLEIEKQTGMKKEMLDNYKDIANVFSNMNDYKNAYYNFQLYSNLKDTTLSEENLKLIKELEAKYENEKKDNEIKLQKSELSKKDLEAKRKNAILLAVGLVALIVIAFSFVLYKQFQAKKKANILLAEQNDEIKKQRDQIFQQKKEITDSIHYASRIQRAVLPSTKLIEDSGFQYFILYKPRDIVSGDFYWINQKDNKIIMAAADCTGHGVPGAFMSMLGMALLNEIVSKGEFENAAQILNQLRSLIIKSLHQSGKIEEAKDGMDLALCIVDKDTEMVQFAGAFNPLYLVRNGELLETSADRMPVGFHDKLDVPFKNNEIKLLKGDTFYIFSDGYVDQFGGENGKKFMAKKFKQLLVSMQQLSMEKQKDILDKNITDWRGELDQVDDIMILGLRV